MQLRGTLCLAMGVGLGLNRENQVIPPKVAEPNHVRVELQHVCLLACMVISLPTSLLV